MIKLERLQTMVQVTNKQRKDYKRIFLKSEDGKLLAITKYKDVDMVSEIGKTNETVSIEIKANIRDFNREIKQLKGNMVDFTINDTLTLTDDTGKALKLDIEHLDNLEINNTVIDENIIDIDIDIFRDIFDSVKDFREKRDNYRPLLQHIHIVDNKIFALDGYKMAIVENEELFKGHTTVLKNDLAYFLDKALPTIKNNEDFKITYNDDFTQIQFNHILITEPNNGDMMPGNEYGNIYDNLKLFIFDVDFTTTTVKVEDLYELIDSFNKDTKIIEIGNREIYTYKVDKEIDDDGLLDVIKLEDNKISENIKFLKDFKIAFNFDFIKTAINSLKEANKIAYSDTVDIKYNKHIEPVVFELDNYTNFVLPVRLQTYKG